MSDAAPRCLVVMGIAASGKSTLARGLAERLGWSLAEGDDFHPDANLAKIRAGQPLTDDDRGPWLDRLGAWISAERDQGRNAVVTCSALRRAYRERLREANPSMLFCHVRVSEALVARRIAVRRDHFMPSSLLGSQLATLEPLDPVEPGFAVDGDAPRAAVLAEALARLTDAFESPAAHG